MATRIAFVITAMLALALPARAQVTSDSKDLQIAKQILQLRTRQLDSIVTAISALSTDRMSPTAKAVYDYVQANLGGGGGGSGGHILAANGTAIAQRDTADFRPADITFALSNTSTVTRITASIAPDSVTTTEIRNGAILAEDLNQMSATTGQVLRWSGSAWVPNGINLYDVVTASGTVAIPNNQIWVGTLGAAISLNLPACNATNNHVKFDFIKSGADTYKVDIEPAGSELFSDGAATKSLYSGATGLSCTCRWNGSSGSWFFFNL